MIDSELLGSFSLFDPLAILVVVSLAVLGTIQGAIRRLLGIASILFSFLVAANLRDPLGGFLASNWTQLPQAYSYMIAFGALFLVLALGFALVSQLFYKQVAVFDRHRWVDPAVGGALGAVQGVILIAVGIVLLDSYFRQGFATHPNEMPLLREIYLALDSSRAAEFFRFSLLPGFMAIAGPFVPTAISAAYPRA
jgi:uncharacterized membrane protein required for colicin V production